MQAPRQVLLTVQTFGEIDIFCFSLSGWVASRGGRGGERERSSDDAQYSRRFFFFSGLSIIPPPRHKISPTQPKWRRSLGSASVQLCYFSLFLLAKMDRDGSTIPSTLLSLETFDS